MLGAINVLSRVLAARAIMLIAVVGGIMLTFPALSQPDWFRLGIIAVYCVGVVVPVAILAAMGR